MTLPGSAPCPAGVGLRPGTAEPYGTRRPYRAAAIVRHLHPTACCALRSRPDRRESCSACTFAGDSHPTDMACTSGSAPRCCAGALQATRSRSSGPPPYEPLELHGGRVKPAARPLVEPYPAARHSLQALEYGCTIGCRRPRDCDTCRGVHHVVQRARRLGDAFQPCLAVHALPACMVRDALRPPLPCSHTRTSCSGRTGSCRA